MVRVTSKCDNRMCDETGRYMEEKMYHTVKSSGIMNIVAGHCNRSWDFCAYRWNALWLARTKILF